MNVAHYISTDPRFCGSQEQVRRFAMALDVTCPDCLSNAIPNFNIDRANSDDENLYVDIPGRGMTAIVTITDEGVGVYLYPLRVADKPLASVHASTEDAMGEET